MTHAVGSDRFDFRPVVREDLPLLADWHAAAHVVQWWQPPEDLEAEYLASFDGTRRFVAYLSDRPIGLIQIYWLADTPNYAALVAAQPGEVGIDYLIGESAYVGRGVGSAMLDVFLRRFASGDEVTGVRVDVAEGNRRSWRTLEKLGFVRTLAGVSVPEESGPHYVYVRVNQR